MKAGAKPVVALPKERAADGFAGAAIRAFTKSRLRMLVELLLKGIFLRPIRER